MPNFESFSKRMVPTKSMPAVTIQRRGALSLNRAAYSAIGSPHAVELLYDRSARVIGVRPIKADADNAYAVRPATRKSGPFVVSAMAFSQFYDIDTSCTRRWPAYLEDGVLCVDLSLDNGDPVTSNRTARPG